MTPGHARGKNGKRYRHHVSAPRVTVRVATGARGWRIPADEVEGAVATVLARHLGDPACANQLITGGDHSSGDAPVLLARLAPDIVERTLDGTQPAHLTAERLRRIGELPLDWDEQRRLLA